MARSSPNWSFLSGYGLPIVATASDATAQIPQDQRQALQLTDPDQVPGNANDAGAVEIFLQRIGNGFVDTRGIDPELLGERHQGAVAPSRPGRPVADADRVCHFGHASRYDEPVCGIIVDETEELARAYDAGGEDRGREILTRPECRHQVLDGFRKPSSNLRKTRFRVEYRTAEGRPTASRGARRDVAPPALDEGIAVQRSEAGSSMSPVWL